MEKQRLKQAAMALSLAVAAALAGCGGNDNSTNPNVTPNSIISIVANAASMDTMAFSPASDTVSVGNIVRMQNNDSFTHQIQPDGLGGPNWGTIPAGRFSDFTATAVGTWPYHCAVIGHTMHGELVILP